MQNSGHIQAIRDNLPRNPNIPIFSVIVFFGSSDLKDVTVGSENDFLIYPGEIQRTIQAITSRPLANFGDKYEVMNVMKQAVDNGTIPEIVSSQHMSASRAGQNRPQSSYYYTFNPFSLLRRLSR